MAAEKSLQRWEIVPEGLSEPWYLHGRPWKYHHGMPFWAAMMAPGTKNQRLSPEGSVLVR